MTVKRTNDAINRLALLEHVNELNIQAIRDESNAKFWTVTVLYNDVIYRHDDNGTTIHEVVKGVPK